ncbi:MAG: hypothetical protein U5M51_04110 [Emticicia sp.]|nr:hypothetical protein [Emticicia sp.]
MKKLLHFLALASIAFANSACSDDCETTGIFLTPVPFTGTHEQIRSGIFA